MLGGFLKSLLEFIYPKVCIVCKNKLKDISSVDNIVCNNCWGKIKRNLPPFCHCCGRHLAAGNLTKNICPRCLRKNLYFDRAFSPCVYEGVIKELTHEFKYKNKEHLAPLLSKLMIEFIKEYSLPLDLINFIVPVPLHKSRLREREFNQALALSSYIADEFKKEILDGCLLRHRPTKTQTELEDSQRFLNVRNSFLVARKEAVKGKNILLVDDVLTTGATSSEAAGALKSAGANIVFVLTLAN